MIKKLLITRSYLGDTQIKPFELNVNHGLLIKGARKVTVLRKCLFNILYKFSCQHTWE